MIGVELIRRLTFIAVVFFLWSKVFRWQLRVIARQWGILKVEWAELVETVRSIRER